MLSNEMTFASYMGHSYVVSYQMTRMLTNYKNICNAAARIYELSMYQ